MRYDLRKFLFVGLRYEEGSFFKKAQQAGIIHFIKTDSHEDREFPVDLQRVMTAIKILRGLPPLEQEENVDLTRADDTVDQILSLKESIDKLSEEQRILGLEIARVSVFGNFSLDDIAFIEKEGKCHIQFFVAKQGMFHDAPLPAGLLYIDSEHNLDYYVAINEALKTYDNMIEMKIEHPLGALQEKAHRVSQEIRLKEHRLMTFAIYNEFLHHALASKMNKYNLHQAQSCTKDILDSGLFAVEGWVPENKVDQIADFVREKRVHYEEIAIEPTDVVPTCLENNGFGRVGEDLVHIYDTPSKTDKDPSLWVLWAFSLFFAFIIGDAGYGLLYLILSLYLHHKFSGAKGVGKRVLKLFTILCVSCVVWGVMTTSFFGIQIDINSPLRKVSLVHWLAEKKADYLMKHKDSSSYKEWAAKYPKLNEAKTPNEFINIGVQEKEGELDYDILSRFSDNVMLELALFIGVVHIILSFLRYIGRNPGGIGWIAFLIGAYLYFPYYLDTPSFLHFVGGVNMEKGSHVGLQLIFGGIATATIIAIFRHGLLGLTEVMAVIQVFADILSYLRLYALGLAGGIVSGVINEMSGSIPFIIAVFLIASAHVVNMLLGVMSGIIHGLRLNFLEWYHYSFEGGGKPFQPLALLEVEKAE